MRARQSAKFLQRRQIAVHREDAIGDDKCMAVIGAMRAQNFFDMRHIVVAEFFHPRARKLRTRPQTGMRQFIDQQQIALTDDHRNDPRIGEIARTEHARCLSALQPCQPPFQYAKQRMIAGDQPRGPRARAVLLYCGDSSGLHPGMMGEVQIIVARERQHPPPAAHHPQRILAHRLGQGALQMPGFQRGQLGFGKGVERGHKTPWLAPIG